MQEARKFLRYITPGILFGVLTIFLLWIALPELVNEMLKACLIAKNNSLALAIGALLASGALGYLFATFHHWCHWYLPIDKDVINHTKQIKKLREKNLIPSLPIESKNPRLEALTMVSILWFERLQESGPIGNSENRVAAFGDLAHAAGTARVASVCSLVTSILVLLSFGTFNPTLFNIIRYGGMLLFGIVVTCLFHDAYSRIGKISQELYDNILEHALLAESKKSKVKTTAESPVED
jgi:hypothetical protein